MRVIKKEIKEKPISTSISFIALIISLIMLVISIKGCMVANDAKDIAEKANNLATEANDIAKAGNTISEEQIKISIQSLTNEELDRRIESWEKLFGDCHNLSKIEEQKLKEAQLSRAKGNYTEEKEYLESINEKDYCYERRGAITGFYAKSANANLWLISLIVIIIIYTGYYILRKKRENESKIA